MEDLSERTNVRPAALSTDSLELVAATLEHVRAELEAPERLASLLGVVVESGWPPGEYDRGAQEFFRDRLNEGGKDVIGWYGWYLIRRGNPGRPSILVGAGGYIGPPNEAGEVEIGFSMMPAWRDKGYATEMVEMLVANAFLDSRVCRIIAHTTPQNRASCRVLEKSGFVLVGGGREPGSIRFEIPRNALTD